MDNRNLPPKQNPPRTRQDSVTPEQRRHMQQGYPVRGDATQTINRPINHPTGPREVPQAMRQGKIPVRQDAVKGRTYPVMNRNGQPLTAPRQNRPAPGTPAGSTLAARSADHMEGLLLQQKGENPSMNRTATLPRVQPQIQQNDLEKTREFPRVPPTSGQQTTAIPKVAPPMPRESQPKKQLPLRTLLVGVVALVLIAALGLGIALSKNTGPEPDFDMSAQYGDVNLPYPDTEAPGVGREEVTETETAPPETTPPPVKFSVTLTFYDRDPITISTSETTLGTLLDQVGYEIQDSDKFPLDLTTLLTEDTTIAVDTVEFTTHTETVSIPFESKVTNVRTIPRGQKNVMQKGQNGTKTITYEVKTVNGAEVSRTVTKEEITTAPVTETYQLGIGGTINGHSYSYYRTVNATYYDIEGITYLGYNADESVVAVDMDYIPLGTKIYVANDQFDFGVRTAADTGSMIEGWEVDIWLADSNPQKAAFAQIGYVTDMIIYYLD